MRATIKDVAAAAGVSIKTVSRVLNHERYVGAETRDRVQAAAASLGFRAGAPAHQAGARRSGQVALLHAAGGPHDVLAILAGARARCAAVGARVIAQACDAAPDRMVADAVALAEATPLDGAILLPPLADHAPLRVALAERGLRTVLVSPADAAAVPAVGAHDAPAGAVMTRHLLALGHRRIGFVGAADAVGRERAAGHRAALSAAGIAEEPALFVEAPHDFPAGARAGTALLELAEPPTAVFAASDTIAAGVLTAAHARGLRVPEDLSVAGFGDEPFAAYVWPPLTTIRVAARDLGEEAADLLRGQADERRDVAFELVERASVIGVGI